MNRKPASQMSVNRCPSIVPRECLIPNIDNFSKTDQCFEISSHSSYLRVSSKPKCVESKTDGSSSIGKCKERHGEFLQDKSLKWRCPDVHRIVKKPIKTNLGNPVGVSFGSFGLKFLEPSTEQEFLQGYATCLIAFGEIFITPEHEWSTLVVNRILEEGRNLIETSMNGELEVELSETTVVKRFVLCKNTMEIEISQPSYVGKIMSDDVTIPNLKDSLQKFFLHNSFGLLWIGEFYFLIWSCMKLFFCFDCYGRDPKNIEMNRETGLASLVCLRSTDNVFHLISKLSNVESNDMFTIRRIQMIKLITCCENAEQLADLPRKVDYKIIHDRYALLTAHLHLGSYCFREFRFKQSLAVAVIALVYSKIDAPCTWDSCILDQVLICGTEFYKKWTYCDHAFDLGIQDIPAQFELGQFTVEIVVNPIRECGNWFCIPNYRQSSLCKAIRRSFEISCNLLVQIERKSYAIWRRNHIYYLLDPYEHQKIGEVQKNKTAMVHMCSTISSLCCTFTQISMEIPTARPFYIHHMKIINVTKTADLRHQDPFAIECSCISKRPNVDDIDEIVSLNESIEDFQCKREFKCLLESGEIEEDEVADLDSPGLSETQIIPHYEDVKLKMLGISEEDANIDDDEYQFLSVSDSSSPDDSKNKKSYQVGKHKKSGDRKRGGRNSGDLGSGVTSTETCGPPSEINLRKIVRADIHKADKCKDIKKRTSDGDSRSDGAAKPGSFCPGRKNGKRRGGRNMHSLENSESSIFEFFLM